MPVLTVLLAIRFIATLMAFYFGIITFGNIIFRPESKVAKYVLFWFSLAVTVLIFV